MTRSLQGCNHQFAGTNLIVCRDVTLARLVPIPRSVPGSLVVEYKGNTFPKLTFALGQARHDKACQA